MDENLKISDPRYDFATSEKISPRWSIELGYTLIVADLLKRVSIAGINFNNAQPTISIGITRAYLTELQILWQNIVCWVWQPEKDIINKELEGILTMVKYLENLATWNKGIRCDEELLVRINNFHKKMSDILVITGLLKKNQIFDDKRLDEL